MIYHYYIAKSIKWTNCPPICYSLPHSYYVFLLFSSFYSPLCYCYEAQQVFWAGQLLARGLSPPQKKPLTLPQMDRACQYHFTVSSPHWPVVWSVPHCLCCGLSGYICSRKGWMGAYKANVIQSIRKEIRNIARGTTDPGYWVYNLNHFSDWNKFEINIGWKRSFKLRTQYPGSVVPLAMFFFKFFATYS